jgi:hypothetical protein
VKRAAVLGLCVLSAIGCASYPGSPSLGLQRSLYPGLGDLDQSGIEAALSQKLELEPPISAGLVWLSEAAAGSPETRTTSPITEYTRTGVLEEAVTALRQEPFGTLAALPTIPNVSDAPPSSRTLDSLRSASARFQYDVALLLQTGTAEDEGVNPFALGYLGIVTRRSSRGKTSRRPRAPSYARSTCARASCSAARGAAPRRWITCSSCGR